MKTKLFILTVVFFSIQINAQESIQIMGKTITGSEIDGKTWLFRDEEDTIVALPYSKYISLYEKAKLAQLNVERLDSIMKAKDELLTSYGNYEAAADSHIVIQKQMIHTADSLFRGYKQIYSDVKTLYDLRPFSAVIGISGLYFQEQKGWNTIFNVGVEYRKVQVSGLFGKEYKGVSLLCRFPLF